MQRDQRPRIMLSLAIVCYHSNHSEIRSLIKSIAVSASSLRKHHHIKRLKLYVVDNIESGRSVLVDLIDDSASKYQELIDIELIAGHGNVGYGRGHNIVIDRIDSNYHLILNPDIEIYNRSLAEGIDYLINNRETVMVSPRAYGADGERQYLCKQYPSIFTLLVRGFFPARLQVHFKQRLEKYEMREMDDRRNSDSDRESPRIASGCFMLCRTDALKNVGGFDNGYFLYFEDYDLSLRLSKEGKISYLPSMEIFHGGGNASKKGWRHILMFIRSGVRFYNTHGWRWLTQ